MIDALVLGRIKHYFYDPVFDSTPLSPLSSAVLISPQEKFYDGKIFTADAVDERDILMTNEVKIEIGTKNIDGALDLVGRLVCGELPEEKTLRFIPRGSDDPAIVFGRVRFRGTVRWQLNAENDQSIVLDFIARPDENGDLFYRA